MCVFGRNELRTHLALDLGGGQRCGLCRVLWAGPCQTVRLTRWRPRPQSRRPPLVLQGAGRKETVMNRIEEGIESIHSFTHSPVQPPSAGHHSLFEL